MPHHRLIPALVACALGAQIAYAGPFTISATFDSGAPTALQADINAAISIYQSTFTDPITVSIFFRYATTSAGGSAVSSGLLAQSNYEFYSGTYSSFVTSLTTDRKSTNDFLAVSNIPAASALPNNPVRMDYTSANGRAVGRNTPGNMNAAGPLVPVLAMSTTASSP